jgi:uncharacterized protein YkwD
MPTASVARTLALTVAATAVTGVVPTAADASTSDASRLRYATNNARDDHRLRDYGSARDLNAVAHHWAAYMAAHHTLQHNPRLTSQVHGWCSVGENVGVGTTATRVQRAFMASRSHRDNILSRTFRQVGVGTARDASGRLYVDVVFRRPC